jgi:5'-nucleotidase
LRLYLGFNFNYNMEKNVAEFRMAKIPRILVVNDDGAGAPGLWALFHRLESFSDPVILAPMREQSARGHAVTIRQPMALAEIEHGGRPVGWRLDGMPADCVKLALSRLYAGQIDLVISGINAGSNTGHNILYSGTVAAAIEGAMYGVPALAISLVDNEGAPTHFDSAAAVASRLALDILAHGLPPGVILNVNVPDLPLDEIEGVVLTRQGRETFVDLFDVVQGPDGERHCLNIGDQRVASTAGEHPLDDLAVADRRVSITPLHFDLTSASALETLRGRIKDLSRPLPRGVESKSQE